jgi:hypothetical protein
MKKFLLFTLIVVLVAGCTPSEPCPEPVPCPTCPEPEEPIGPDPEWIFEIKPENFGVILLDPYGNNLLDPNYVGNILDRNFTATYNGKTYSTNDAAETGTRVILPKWYGLRFGQFHGYLGDNGTPALLFGQFGVDTDAEFTIDWGWGQTDFRIQFSGTWALWTEDSHYGTPESHPYSVPVYHRKVWADGTLINESGLVACATLSNGNSSALGSKNIDLDFKEIKGAAD